MADNIIQLTPEQEAKIKEQFSAKPSSDVVTQTQVDKIITQTEDTKSILRDAELHLKHIEENMLHFQGKPGMNPYAWLRSKNIPKLKKQLAKGDVLAAIEILKINHNEKPTIREYDYVDTQDEEEEPQDLRKRKEPSL